MFWGNPVSSGRERSSPAVAEPAGDPHGAQKRPRAGEVWGLALPILMRGRHPNRPRAFSAFPATSTPCWIWSAREADTDVVI